MTNEIYKNNFFAGDLSRPAKFSTAVGVAEEIPPANIISNFLDIYLTILDMDEEPLSKEAKDTLVYLSQRIFYGARIKRK